MIQLLVILFLCFCWGGHFAGVRVCHIDAWPTCGLMYMIERMEQTLDTVVGAMTLLLVRRYVDID